MKDYIGFQVSTQNIGIYGALKFMQQLGANSLQIFMRSPKDNFEEFTKSKEILESKKKIYQYKTFLISHSIVNVARDFKKNLFNLESLITDMKKIDFLGGKGVIVHIGDYSLENRIDAHKNIKKSINYVLGKTPGTVKIIFENVAGSQREQGFKFEELKTVYNLFSNKDKQRIDFVIDTCHSHVSGYDLSNKKGIENWSNEIEKHLNWKKVICIHLNDSYGDIESRLDKHADLGFGQIGAKSLKEIVLIIRKKSIPIIIETPQKEETIQEQIKLIKGWV